MSIDALIGALEREAEDRGRLILAEAADRAREIRDQAREEVERRRASRLEEHRRRHRAEASRRVAAARREVDERVLAAREELLEEIFGRARERLPGTLATDAYRSVLPAHLDEALRFVDLESREAEVLVPGQLEEAVADLLADPERSSSRGGAAVAVVTGDDAPPGVTVRAADGHVVVDNSLPGRLTRRRASVAMRLVDLIEGEGPRREGGSGGGSGEEVSG